MFRGITKLTLDSKGRVAVPTRYRESLDLSSKGAVVITIDTEETCLLLYPLTEWQVIENKLQALPSFNAAARRIQRLLIGHATDIELDGNGRLLIPQVLRDHARLEKSLVMIGQGNKFELWNEELWQEKCSGWLADEAARQEPLPEEMKILSL